MLCVHNLARSAQAVELDLRAWEGRYPVEMFGRTRFPRIGELPYLLTLAPRGFYWFLLRGRADARRLLTLDDAILPTGSSSSAGSRSKPREVAHVDAARGPTCATEPPLLDARAASRRRFPAARTSSTSCCSARAPAGRGLAPRA